MEPFQSELLHPNRSSINGTSIKIKNRADCRHKFHIQPCAIFQNKLFLLGRGKPDPQNIRCRRIHRLDHRSDLGTGINRPERRRINPDNLNMRIVLRHSSLNQIQRSHGRAKEKNAHSAGIIQPLIQTGENIRTGDPFPYITAQNTRSQHHTHTVRHQPVCIFERLGKNVIPQGHHIRMRIKAGKPGSPAFLQGLEYLFCALRRRKGVYLIAKNIFFHFLFSIHIS